MEMILAILLWIGCIQPQTTYMQPFINNVTSANQPVINQVLTTQPMADCIWQQYGVMVQSVNVIDPFVN